MPATAHHADCRFLPPPTVDHKHHHTTTTPLSTPLISSHLEGRWWLEAAVGVLSVWPFGPDPTVGFWGSTVTQYYIRNVIDLGVTAASN